MFYKEQARPGSAFLEHLEAHGLEISANHGGRNEGWELLKFLLIRFIKIFFPLFIVNFLLLN